MKYKISVQAALLLAISTASAQIASHAPTHFAQPPSQKSAANPLALADKPVARVNGAVLTDADLQREEYAIFPYARQHSGIPKDLAPQIRAGAMQMLVFEELVYQDAVRRHLSVPPLKLQHAEAEFHKQFATPEEFNAFLQTDFHGSRTLLQDKIRRSLLIEAYLKAEVGSKSSISLAEAKAYYDHNPAQFQHPESFTFQTISVLPPDKASPAQLLEGRLRAEKAQKQAKATKSSEEFGLLAEKSSDDDYRVMMGQHKPVPVDQLDPQIVKTLHSMHPGDVSGVIQMEQAYTIIRLQVHTLAGEAKFAEVSKDLQKDLQQKKTNALRKALDSKLRQNAKIEGM